MPNAIDGIGTINVSQLVGQLMQLEGRTQDLIKQKKSKEQDKLQNFQNLAGYVRGISAQAKAITGTSEPAVWNKFAVTSSSTSVTASITGDARPGTFSFNVTKLAAAMRTTYEGPLSQDDIIAGGGSLAVNGKTVNVGNGSLAEVVAAINADSSLNVRAAAIGAGDGTFRLQLSATKTGTQNAFTVDGLDPLIGYAQTTAAADATLDVDGVLVKSSSNTFSEVMPGLTFTASAITTAPVTISIDQDVDGKVTQLKSLIDAANNALSNIDFTTNYDADTKKGGPLLGESLPSMLSQALQSTVSGNQTGKPLSTLGIELSRDGKLNFDSAKFKLALTADPDGASEAIAALSARLGKVADDMTESSKGLLSQRIASEQTSIKGLTDSIADWDRRLSLRQASLTAQFSALNVALSKMGQQQSWLTGQLSKLSSSSG